MILKFGNMSVRQFEEKTGTKFTDAEVATLESYRCDDANANTTDGFHIFDDPAISVHIGAVALEATMPIWKAAQARSPLNRAVTFYPWDRKEAES